MDSAPGGGWGHKNQRAGRAQKKGHLTRPAHRLGDSLRTFARDLRAALWTFLKRADHLKKRRLGRSSQKKTKKKRRRGGPDVIHHKSPISVTSGGEGKTKGKKRDAGGRRKGRLGARMTSPKVKEATARELWAPGKKSDFGTRQSARKSLSLRRGVLGLGSVTTDFRLMTEGNSSLQGTQMTSPLGVSPRIAVLLSRLWWGSRPFREKPPRSEGLKKSRRERPFKGFPSPSALPNS